MLDPFRKSLGRARQWYGGMLLYIEEEVEVAIGYAALAGPSPSATPPQNSSVEQPQQPCEEPTPLETTVPPNDSSTSQAILSGSRSIDRGIETQAANEQPPRQKSERDVSGLRPAPLPSPPQAPPPNATPSLLTTAAPETPQPSANSGFPVHDALPPSNRSECARILQSRCPSCFGGTNFGKSLKE